MTRTTETADRFATLVVALALIALGVLGVIWRLDQWIPLPRAVSTSSAQRLTESGRWPWALAAAGILLLLIGLRWLVAHLRTTGIREVNLPGTSKAGHLSVDVKAAASGAADALAATNGVRHVSGKAVRQRGQLVVDLDATIDSDAELADIASSADRVSAELAQVLGRPDIYCRVRVGVANSSSGRRLR